MHRLEAVTHDERNYDQRCRGVSPSDLPDRVQSNAHQGNPRKIGTQSGFDSIGPQGRAVSRR